MPWMRQAQRRDQLHFALLHFCGQQSDSPPPHPASFRKHGLQYDMELLSLCTSFHSVRAAVHGFFFSPHSRPQEEVLFSHVMGETPM